jgi:adenylate cyclase class IV
MSNNPEKINKLQSLGIIIEGRTPIEIQQNPHSEQYLKTKKEKLGHLINTMESADNNLELEIKFLISPKDISALKEKVLKIPTIFYEGRVYEKTTMLDNFDGLMQKDDARLRVREIKENKEDKYSKSKIEFSYKRRIKADGGIKQEEEIENSFIADAASFFQILNKMGYKITTGYERYRETYKTQDIKITLDEFPFGYILEIESVEKNINKICDFLNLDKQKSYPLSCDDVYVELCEKKGIKPKDHILFDDPEMPRLE